MQLRNVTLVYLPSSPKGELYISNGRFHGAIKAGAEEGIQPTNASVRL